MNRDLPAGRNYVWRLLKLRLRTEFEIRDKLKFKNFAAALIDELIAYFKEKGYINDREFANFWIEGRLNKPLGFKAITRELESKGLSGELVQELISLKKKEVDEVSLARELTQRQFNKLKEKKEPADKIKPKLYGYLARRGFSYETISEIITEL
ncbi:MAG: regulatory protein RecX [Candidatus Omnitrophota bacterium]|nr:regulatory protein RecX [Candidatus Omnitrophota bacterium]